jgi:hypothetical protein
MPEESGGHFDGAKCEFGDSPFQDALRARLTILVGDGANEIEEGARNAEVNAESTLDDDATFGAKKEVNKSGTEPIEAQAPPSSVIPACAGRT